MPEIYYPIVAKIRLWNTDELIAFLPWEKEGGEREEQKELSKSPRTGCDW